MPTTASPDRIGESSRWRWLLPVCAGLAGLAFLSLLAAPYWELVRNGWNDFPAFYLGPRLLAEGRLYDSAAFQEEQIRALGRVCRNIQFVRPPFVAVLFTPLSHLPYGLAYALWQALSLGALVLFLRLWPARRMQAAVLCCWFPPVAASFMNGQDVTFLLLWAALGTLLVRRGQETAAGAVLALGAAKFHLLLFLPVLIVARRMWRLAAGLAGGAALLLAVSFLAAGPGWPAAYLRQLQHPEVHPDIQRTSLAALLGSVLQGPALWAALIVLTAAAAVLVWRTSRRHTVPLALAAALAAGPLAGFHVYLQDYLLTFPLAALLLAGEERGQG